MGKNRHLASLAFSCFINPYYTTYYTFRIVKYKHYNSIYYKTYAAILKKLRQKAD